MDFVSAEDSNYRDDAWVVLLVLVYRKLFV